MKKVIAIFLHHQSSCHHCSWHRSYSFTLSVDKQCVLVVNWIYWRCITLLCSSVLVNDWRSLARHLHHVHLANYD